MPKEPRPTASTQIPRVDGSRMGPRVDRLLRDLAAEGLSGYRASMVLQLGALHPREPAAALAAEVELPLRTWWHLKRRGLLWLEEALIMAPSDER